MSDIFNSILQNSYSNPTNMAKTSQAVSEPVKVNNSVAAATETKNEADSLVLSEKKHQKKHPIKSVKTFISNVKQTFATAGEYIKGGAKGVTTGAVAASLIYTAGAIINHVRKDSKKLPNVPLAIAAAVISLAANLWNASLNATQRSSEIEMRWVGLDENKK